jgi:hypothetical protein
MREWESQERVRLGRVWKKDFRDRKEVELLWNKKKTNEMVTHRKEKDDEIKMWEEKILKESVGAQWVQMREFLKVVGNEN